MRAVSTEAPAHRTRDDFSAQRVEGVDSIRTRPPEDCKRPSQDSARVAFRLPVTYRGIPLFAASVDILLIVASAVVAGTLYHFTVAAMDGEFSRNMAAAVFVAVLCVAATWTRKLYEPSRLLLWDDQIRSLLGTWCGSFLLMASGVFTWGVGKDLSRGTILSFWAIGGAALLAHRWLWRLYLPGALANGAIKGRNCVVVAWGEGAATPYSQLLSRHGYIVVRIFEIPEAEACSAAVMAAVVRYVRGQANRRYIPLATKRAHPRCGQRGEGAARPPRPGHHDPRSDARRPRRQSPL